jgi:E3 ubiquitin-protein ligase MYLIP
MLSLVSLPDSSVFEVDFDSQSTGLEILNKVCERFGIIEVDYFGLIHETGRKGERLWLNLRNRVSCELCGSQPYRLELRVKFFVPPHMIQQDVTRHNFYLNVCEAFISGRLHVPSRLLTAKLAAMIAHVEIGEASTVVAGGDSVIREQQFSRLVPTTAGEVDSDMLSLIGGEYSKLSGVAPATIKYQVLQTVAELPSYGTCSHDARTNAGSQIRIDVGADGIAIYGNDWTEIKCIEYSSIQKLTHDGYNLLLEIIGDDCVTTESHVFRLASRMSASALYRAMTEKYYFYHCDTVGCDVMSQYCRDLKGTLASLFNEHTNLGKSYVFDIQRTMSEAYDRVRRILYANGGGAGSVCSSTESMFDGSCSSPAHKLQRTETEPTTAAKEELKNKESCLACCTQCSHCQDLRDTVQHFQDSITCQMCIDSKIDTALVPCGHVMCCAACAVRLDVCPLCKVAITQRLKIFLPYAVGVRTSVGSDASRCETALTVSA